MFDFESFEKEIDEQNAALESMLAEMDNVDGTDSTNTDADAEESIAEEGLLSKPKSTDDMIAKVQKSVNKKCKTVEDCDDFLAKLKNEEQKFNSSLKAMKAAAIQFQKDGDKKALKAAIKPAKAELAKTCSIISLKDVGSADNITDEEIKKLRGFLTGARKVIAEKKKELKNAAKAATAAESDTTSYLDYEPAMEAFANMKLRLRDICLTMAKKCHDFASKKQSEDGDSNKSFWASAEKFFRDIAGKLEGKVTPEELNKYNEAVTKKRTECEEKKNAKAMKKEAAKKEKEALSHAKNVFGQDTKESFTAITPYDMIFQDACEEFNSIMQAGCESFFDMINGEDEEEPQTAEEAAFIAGYNSAMEAMQDAQIEQALEEIDTLFEFE